MKELSIEEKAKRYDNLLVKLQKAKVIKTGEVVDVYHEPQHGQISNIYKESVLVNGRMWTEDELDFSVKANEAPEKLYFLFNHPYTVDYTKLNKRRCDEEIEYTRTDAFIERACEWLSDNLQTIVDVDCPSKHHVESIPVLGSITQTEFLRKFREEIKYLFD